MEPTTNVVITQSGGGIAAMIFSCGMLIVGLLLLAFWIWMLVDCATKESKEGNTKIVWILVIALTSWLGALIYYLVRRPQRIRETGR
jgi:uncharacterized protein with PQ loop repeat